jgi:hypothetical protein
MVANIFGYNLCLIKLNLYLIFNLSNYYGDNSACITRVGKEHDGCCRKVFAC